MKIPKSLQFVHCSVRLVILYDIVVQEVFVICLLLCVRILLPQHNWKEAS
jgi:hypothetical protein